MFVQVYFRKPGHFKTCVHFSVLVGQNRNVHDLMKDFTDEIEGYKRNNEFIDIIDKIKLKRGVKNINKNLLFLYKNLIQKNFFKKKELKLVQAWIYDIEKML